VCLSDAAASHGNARSATTATARLIVILLRMGDFGAVRPREETHLP